MIHKSATPADLTLAAQSGRMSDHLVRVANLKAHQRAHSWDDSELARQCGRKPQQIYAWFNASGEGGRKIGEKLARSIEDRLGLARYALDDRNGAVSAEEPSAKWGNVLPATGSVTRKSRELPIVLWAEITEMLPIENAQLARRLRHLGSFAPSSTKAKFVEMPDDSMAPDFLPGDHILFDPSEAPRAGDVVLVTIASGELFVRVFKPKTAMSYEAVPINAAYAPISSIDDAAEVLAVMVEHRRYRRTT